MRSYAQVCDMVYFVTRDPKAEIMVVPAPIYTICHDPDIR